jgi:hypothetical protein
MHVAAGPPFLAPAREFLSFFRLSIGAGEGIRTLDPDLGKVVAGRLGSFCSKKRSFDASLFQSQIVGLEIAKGARFKLAASPPCRQLENTGF